MPTAQPKFVNASALDTPSPHSSPILIKGGRVPTLHALTLRTLVLLFVPHARKQNP